MNFKSLLAALVMVLGASMAQAITVIETDCGVIDDNTTVDCGDFNLAQNDTIYSFEATVDTADADTPKDGLAGTLRIGTYVDPYYSTGFADANILLTVTGGFTSATLTYGAQTVNLIPVIGKTIASVTITEKFPGVGIGNGLDLLLSYTGLKGGDQISIQVSAVPLPASLLLLTGALGGLGLMRRRRQMAA